MSVHVCMCVHLCSMYIYVQLFIYIIYWVIYLTQKLLLLSEISNIAIINKPIKMISLPVSNSTRRLVSKLSDNNEHEFFHEITTARILVHGLTASWTQVSTCCNN